VPAGSTGRPPFSLDITPERAGWTYSGLRILTLAAGEQATFDTGPDEMILLPLAGAASVTCDADTVPLTGRRDVFAAVTDFAYLPLDASVTGGRPAGAVSHCRPPEHSSDCPSVMFRPRMCPSSCAAPARPAGRSTTSARPGRSSRTG
jgi:5-deoxy-D-glucuronate isomerase